MKMYYCAFQLLCDNGYVDAYIPSTLQMNVILAAPETTYYLTGVPIPEVTPLTQYIVPKGMVMTSLPTFPMITSLTEVPEEIPSAIYGMSFQITLREDDRVSQLAQ